MDLTKVEFDGIKRKLVFHGDCLEMHAVCQAMCCREWDVNISAEEHTSGQYESEVICALTEQTCISTIQPCINRLYRLAKREDRSCVYLKGNLCQIYAMRPYVCRNMSCRNGWHIDSVFSDHTTQSDQKPPTLTREAFVGHLTDDMTFVLHPLLKVHTVFYLKQRREIIIVKEMVGTCRKFNTRDCFDFQQLDDAQILALINLFGRKEPLGQIYRIYCEQNAVILTLKDFFGIVWLLNKQNIVLESRFFSGMLGSIHGLY